MGKKLDSGAISKATVHNPGPGNYNPDFKASKPSLPKFSIKGRYAEKAKMQAPSPGTYSYGFSDRESAPKFGFGTAPQRLSLAK